MCTLRQNHDKFEPAFQVESRRTALSCQQTAYAGARLGRQKPFSRDQHASASLCFTSRISTRAERMRATFFFLRAIRTRISERCPAPALFARSVRPCRLTSKGKISTRYANKHFLLNCDDRRIRCLAIALFPGVNDRGHTQDVGTRCAVADDQDCWLCCLQRDVST
ncbi:hypothetical protein OG21DRAFT_415026 [Imleria badia]|nr:hypothetical protein OG21DRAFT_415026 [Imleria badia]